MRFVFLVGVSGSIAVCGMEAKNQTSPKFFCRTSTRPLFFVYSDEVSDEPAFLAEISASFASKIM